MLKTHFRSKPAFISFLIFSVVCLGFLSSPALNKSSAGVATVLICPSSSTINSLGGINAPYNNANNSWFRGVDATAFSQLNILSGGDWANQNWASGDGIDGGRYPGVRLGAGPWEINGTSTGINGLGVGQRLGNGNFSYYADLENNCANPSGNGFLEAKIRPNSNANLPAYSNNGGIHRSTIRISTPVGDINQAIGHTVGFSTITLDEGLMAKYTNSAGARPQGTGWQARTIVFNPNNATNPGSAYEQQKNILGCIFYVAEENCNDNRVISQARWDNGYQLANNSLGVWQAWIGTQNTWMNGLINPNGSATATWANGYDSAYKNPNNASINPANIFRRDFVAEVFCNMSPEVYAGYTTCKADGGSVPANAYAKIRNFYGWIQDNEPPTSNLYRMTSSGYQEHIQPVAYGGNQGSNVWINSRPNVNRTLSFAAMDGGLGIARIAPTINGIALPVADWNWQCTEWGNAGGSTGSVQYRVDRSQQVARTGSAFGKAIRYTINQPPICSAVEQYSTQVNLAPIGNPNAANPFREGTNIFRANLTDYTKPGTTGANTSAEERQIKIDSIAPSVDFSLISTGSNSRCYAPSTGTAQQNCLTIQNSSPANESKYIRGTVNFFSSANDPRGQLPNSSSNLSHSGLSLVGTNFFRINGNVVRDCAAPIIVATYNYNTSSYNACSNTFDTKSYGNGSTVQFQTNVLDNAGNTGWKLSQPFIIDNIAPENTSTIVGNDLIKLSATDPANGSGVKNNQVEYRVQATQPGTGVVGTFVANGTSINIGQNNSVIWVRAEDNVGNVSPWKKFDFTEPEATVACEETTKVNTEWYGPGEIPCWIEASGNDGRTARISETQYVYMTPSGSDNSGWTVNQAKFFMDGETVSAYQPVYVGSPSVEMTQVLPFPVSSQDDELEGVFKGRKYFVIMRTGLDWNPAKADWLATGWNTPKTIARYPTNYFNATTGGGVKPSNEQLNSATPEKYMATAYVQPYYAELPAGSEVTIGISALGSSGIISSTPRPEPAQGGSWTKIRALLSVPAGTHIFIPPYIMLSKAPTGNENSYKSLVNVDYTLISKVFDIPAGIQGKTNLLGKSSNVNGVWSQNDSKTINKDATPPDLNNKTIAPSIDSNLNDGVNTSGRKDNDGKYSGFMRLSINAKDLFVGDDAYTPGNSELEPAAKTAAQNLKDAYDDVSATILDGWAQESSGMASGSWIACSVDNVGESACLQTPPNSLVDASGYSPYFVIQQDNALVPDLCRGTTFVGAEDGDYSCIFDTRVLPFKQGDYYFRFRAEDAAGNVSYSAPEKRTIAKQACVIPGNIVP